MVLLWASYLYVPIICTICLGAKISRCQYVSEKVLGRYIRRLRDITYLSTISIIILASYLFVIVVLLGSLARFLRCLREKYYDGTYDKNLCKYLFTISWWMSQNISRKEYLDTYLKRIPRIFGFAFFFVIRFPAFRSTDGETERERYVLFPEDKGTNCPPNI